jgi:hypothetical protein
MSSALCQTSEGTKLNLDFIAVGSFAPVYWERSYFYATWAFRPKTVIDIAVAQYLNGKHRRQTFKTARTEPSFFVQKPSAHFPRTSKTPLTNSNAMN